MDWTIYLNTGASLINFYCIKKTAHSIIDMGYYTIVDTFLYIVWFDVEKFTHLINSNPNFINMQALYHYKKHLSVAILGQQLLPLVGLNTYW